MIVRLLIYFFESTFGLKKYSFAHAWNLRPIDLLIPLGLVLFFFSVHGFAASTLVRDEDDVIMTNEEKKLWKWKSSFVDSKHRSRQRIDLSPQHRPFLFPCPSPPFVRLHSLSYLTVCRRVSGGGTDNKRTSETHRESQVCAWAEINVAFLERRVRYPRVK